MKWHSGASDFKGDVSEAVRQMTERDMPQAEESPQAKLERDAYAAQEAEARGIQEQAAQLRKDVEHRRGVENKLARDAEIERRGDSTNYYSVGDRLFFQDPVTKKTFFVNEYGRHIYVKQPPKKPDDTSELADAIRRVKSRRTNTSIPF